MTHSRIPFRTGIAALACVTAAITAAGCSNTTHTSAPTTTTTTAAPSTGSVSSFSPAQTAAVINCLRAQGLSIPAGTSATLKQLRTAFTAVPAAKRQAIYNACSTTIPAALRQELQARIAKKADSTTTSTAP